MLGEKKAKRSMEDWDKIFAKCDPIKSIESMVGCHEGEILQYSHWVVSAANSIYHYNWFGKSFDKHGNASALIMQSWLGIPTFCKWNFVPFGFAHLKSIEFEGKKSIAMKYNYLPITDHMRQYIDENKRECFLGIMVIAGYKLMYFKLYK